MFLDKLRQEVDANLNNDQFGVEELARKMGMSRSQLHRKLTGVTGQSISQFIREHRLQRGMELLKKGELTAAEVSDRIGFGSPTYFSKCFSDHYGFPPGEVKNRIAELNIPANGSSVHPPSAPGKTRSRFLPVFIAGALLIAVAIVYFNIGQRSGGSEVMRDKSIAILPFKDLSGDSKNRYFTEGVIEAVRTSLSQLGDLRVISRTSVEQYRESDKRARDIARELGVAALLEGSIQRNDNKIRMDVRLVDGASEVLVWARSYDREWEDVFSIQREIAQQVARELNATLTSEERSNLVRTETKSSRAYDLYLRGVYEYRTYTNRGAHNSIRLLTEAIALDPGYARAHAFLANSYIALATIFGAEWSAVEALETGKPFIDKALELDPFLDEAHMLMGFYHLYHDWDFKAAEAEYKQAIANNHPDALALYIDFLNFTSRHDEAMVMARRLNERDPYYPNSRMIQAYIYNGRFQDALEFSESRLKMFNNYLTLDSHGFLLLNMGRYEEAIVYFDKAMELEGIRYPRMLGWSGAAWAKSGNTRQAMKIIAELQDRLAKNDKGSVSFFIAVVYSALGDKVSALRWLQAAYDSHDMEMPWLMTEPQFYILHQEPEFQKLASLMGFPRGS